jgi:hypothetical protein
MKRLRLLSIGLGVVIVVLVIVIGGLVLSNRSTQDELAVEKRANQALFEDSGKMCATLSINEAVALLESDVVPGATSYPNGFAFAIEGSQFKPKIDSCRYVGETNNTRYLYIIGQRYGNESNAAEDFALQKKLLQDATDLPASGYGDEMIYYGGAIFLRDGNKIVSVSINKPETSSNDQQAFTTKVFDQVYKNALSIL